MAEVTIIIDYGSGNIRSASKAFERMASEAGAGQKVVVTSDPEAVNGACRIVLPGVGAFADCHAGLLAIPGMMEALRAVVIDKGRPFFGICVGMQLMATRGLEHGAHDGFDWIPGDVSAIAPAGQLKVPHMGWNELSLCVQDHPLLVGIGEGYHAYFVHSYQLQAENAAHVLATVDYGGTVTAMIGRDNLVGTQFHPEKSQATGLRLIANFLAWKP